jgi:hypothetical protein
MEAAVNVTPDAETLFFRPYLGQNEKKRYERVDASQSLANNHESPDVYRFTSTGRESNAI